MSLPDNSLKKLNALYEKMNKRSLTKLKKIIWLVKKRRREDYNMGLVVELARILLLVVIVGWFVVFVVMRMKQKYKIGSLGKKKSKSAQNLLDSLIPFGMMVGCVVAVLLSIFFPSPLLSSVGLGAGIGLLFGCFAYEIYSKKEESY